MRPKAVAESQRPTVGASSATIGRRAASEEGARIAEILRLQGTAGNSAVSALLAVQGAAWPPTAGNRALSALLAPIRSDRPADGSRVRGQASQAAPRFWTGGAVVVQRAAFGLMKKGEVSGFAGLAVDFWRANKDASLEDFSRRLMDELNQTLAGNGVPKLPPPDFGVTPHAAAGFAAKTWTIVLDPAKTAGHPLTTKIGELNADQVAEVAGICYHEARHAEQAFLVARLVASQATGKKDPAAIATALEIPVRIADAAVKSKDPMPGKKDLGLVEQWRAFSPSGKHRDYQDWNETFRGFVENVMDHFPSPSPAGVDKVTATWQALTPTIASWRKDSLPFVDDKISRLKKAKTPGPSDDQVLGHLRKIRAGGRQVIDADKALGDEIAKFEARKAEATTKPLTVSEARVIQSAFALGWLDLEVAVRTLEQTSNDAYESYPHEADAYAAEHAVMKVFQSKAKSTRAKP